MIVRDCKSRIIDLTQIHIREMDERAFRSLGWCHMIPALALITLNFRLQNVGEVIQQATYPAYMYERDQIASDNVEIAYLYYSLKYGFVRDMCPQDRDERRDNQMDIVFNEEYYRSLEPMTQPEIVELLKTNLVNYPRRLVNGTHRAFAMAGHLARGGEYAPFYSMDLT